MNSTIQNPIFKYFRSGILTATATLVGLTSSVNAGLISYEGFEYVAGGTSLSTLNGGVGWTTAWDNGGWRTPSTGFGENEASLSYSTLTISGTSARAANDNDQSFRQFAPQPASGIYWISVLMRVDAADNNPSGSFGLSLFDGASTERNFLGKAGNPNWGVAGQGASNSGVPIVGNTTTFILARYNMDTGLAHFWLNPTPGGAQPTDASAFNGPAGTNFTPFTFDRIRLGRFGANGYIDEFRLGTTFTDVAPFTAEFFAYEGFDYPTGGSSLDTLQGGIGFTTAWAGGGWRTPSVGFGENDATLSYSSLTVGGTSARAGGDFNQGFRQFATQVASGTYWISLLMNVDDADAAGNGSLGISLFNGNTEQNFIGKAGSANWGVAVAGGNDSGVAISGGTDIFILARYNMETGKAHFWLNPTLGGAEPTDDSAFNGEAGTVFTPFSFDRVRLGRFGANGYIDEFRIGRNFASVAPSSGNTELANFRSSNGLAADGSQDLLTPANDGVTNLMKYAFNMIGAGAGQAATLSIPNVTGFNGTAGLPLVGRESGTGKLTLTYLRRKAFGSPAPGITYSVQFGSTLADFAVNGAATEVPTSIDATFESVVVTDSVLPPGKRFARLQVTAP